MSTPIPRPSRRRARRIAIVLTGCVAAAALTIPVLTPSGDDTAHAAMPMVAVPAAANEPTSQILPRDGWTVEASDHQGTSIADKAIDGDDKTYWVSHWRPNATPFPHSLVIDMKTPAAVSGLRYLARPDKNGRIGDYEISVSTDKKTWTSMTTGIWADDAVEKTAAFATTTARYVRLTATSEAGERGPWTSVAEINLVGAPLLARDGWSIEASDSEPVNPPTRMLDGDPKTAWVDNWYAPGTPFPHWFTIDTKTPVAVSGLRYLPRADGPNGRVGDYEISVSTDKKTWTTVTSGTWPDDNTEKTASFTTTTARYIRLTATSEAGNRGPWSSAAEINLQAAPPTTPVAPPTTELPSAPDPASTAGLQGSWGSVIGFPLVPTSMAVLPNGKVLLWAAYSTTSYGHGSIAKTQVAIYDPATNKTSNREIVNTKHEMFCSGLSMLPDGRLLIVGGSNGDATTIYDPDKDSWTVGPKLNTPRGYQSDVTLTNGSVLTLGGSWSGTNGGKDGELYTPDGTWKRLPGITADKILTKDWGGVHRADNHAWLFSVGQGNVFHAGPSTQMHWISTRGNGSMASAGSRTGDGHAMNGNAVMYAPGKILTNGGAPSYTSSRATTNAFVIDITAGYGKTPKVTATGSMASARAYQNSVVLPDGTVLVVGGQAYARLFTDTTPAMSPELWNPGTGTFTEMSAMAVPRNYHGVAQLLPDGRVLAAGGGLCGKCATNHPDGQIFTPPYLLNTDGTPRTRPTITTAPTDGQATKTITVKTGAAVASFALVRMGATTHAVNTDQRRIPLAAGTGTTHTLKIPDRAKVTPGDYMLFALDANGTPSIAKIINIR